jgi:hypothetical protein
MGFALAILALPGIVSTSHGQAPPPTDSITNSFPNDGSQPHSWIYWYGWNAGNSAIAWDGTKDAGNDPNSGSLMITLPMTNNNQQVWFGTFQNTSPYSGGVVYDGTFFTNIDFDILMDPSSITNTTGDFGPMYVSLVRSGTPDGGSPFNAANQITIPANAATGWVHLSVPVLTNVPGFSSPGVIGVDFRLDTFGPSYRIGQTNIFWLDNIAVKFSGTPPPPPPPPSLFTPEKPFQNLNFFSGGGGDYNRESIRPIGVSVSSANYAFLGNSDVTYSFTVSDYPGPTHGGFHWHVYLVPSPYTGTGDNLIAPDYQEPTVIFLSLDFNNNGSGTYTFRWKTNSMASNGFPDVGANNTNHFFNAPHEFVVGPSALGTWKARFQNDTNITLTAPDGSFTNFNIPQSLADQFPSPIHVYFGIQADTADVDKGVAMAISHIGIQGSPNEIDAYFTNSVPLDTIATWEVEANVPSGIFVMPPEASYLVSWPQANATGFNLQTNSVLTDTNGWTTNGLPGPFAFGTLFRTLLNTNDAPPEATRFFRLAKPGF